MGYYVVVGGTTMESLASIAGWRDVRRWSESLDVREFPEIFQFVEHGLSQNLAAFQKELETVLAEKKPDDDSITKTITDLLKTITKRKRNAVCAFVSDGFVEEKPKPKKKATPKRKAATKAKPKRKGN